MSRTFLDQNLQQWEAFPSGGKFGLPDRPKIVFLCLSDPSAASRGRYFLVEDGDEAKAQAIVCDASDDRLRELLSQSRALD